MLQWHKNPTFNTSYVESLYHTLHIQGSLSPKQIQDLDNTYRGWHLQAFKTKDYYPKWKDKAPTPGAHAFLPDDV